jgi:dihydrofolate synthase/folylpolyglutamate synthase
MTYSEAVEYMSSLRRHGQRTDRSRFVALLERLGNPHLSLRCLHVAGTNGKGSTVTFIASVLQQAGYRVGMYLSPYVFDLRERVQINNTLISQEDFARHVAAIRPPIEELALTEYGPTPEFELKTAIAFRHFAESQVDFAVVEVGIGGRLDATNVIPPPLVAVITQIGWDHQNLLGDTLGKIATEKAGIFKPGTIGVTAEPPGEALKAIRERASLLNIPLHLVRPDDSPEAFLARVRYRRDTEGTVHLRLPGDEHLALRMNLRGAFQAGNAATAAGAISVLRQEHGIPISSEVLQNGLERATIPGRFQILRPSPAYPTLVLDGAHNADGAQILVEALQAEFGHGQRFTFVFGTSKGHEPEPFLQVIAPITKKIVAVSPQFRATSPDEIVRLATAIGLPAEAYPTVAEGVQEAVYTHSSKDIVVVTGSFYVVGETPEEFRGKMESLPKKKGDEGLALAAPTTARGEKRRSRL